MWYYEVTNFHAIQTNVIPFFKRFRFLSAKKKRDFSKFQQIAKIIETKEHLTIQFRELNQARDEVEAALKNKLEELELQSERIHSIETAMTSSLQHSSDLEASLVRWQELAEVTEKRVNELVVARLPQKLLKRGRPAAIDVTEIPYHGQYDEADDLNAACRIRSDRGLWHRALIQSSHTPSKA